MKKIAILTILISSILLGSCQKEETPIEITPQTYYEIVDKVTETMVHDIFSPPVASRIYVYPNIAAYEIIAQNNPNYNSLHNQIQGFEPIPKVENEKVNLKLAAIVAHIEVSSRLIFTQEILNKYRDSLFLEYGKMNSTEFENSKTYGLKVADHIMSWVIKDQYKETRTMEKFAVEIGNESRWQPTPPNYMGGIEPHWNKIRTLVLDSASQFMPSRHPEFSMDKNSVFYKQLVEVYETGQAIRKEGDQSEKLKIAQFWDCNPFVAVSTGHLTMASKKITPGGHWIGITKIACQQSKYNFDDTVYAYTKTSLGIFDAFISCWDEKYRSNLIRPETLINNHIDKDWKPLLQTPPFPEYPSGHSVASGAASTILTSIFGDNFKYTDNTEVSYGLPKRDFTSFNQAADEAAISRLYGGIHYRAAIDNGLEQGRKLGNYVVTKIKMKK